MSLEFYKLNTDGGSRDNPGNAAIGVILKDPNNIIVSTISKPIGIFTNNYAEYTALIEGLNMAASKSIKNIKCYLDSELVVKQVNGQYKVKEETLKLLHKQVSLLKKQFEHIEFIHVRRAFNSEADKLVNTALDKLETGTN